MRHGVGMEAYRNCVAAETLRQRRQSGQPLRLALVDIDETMIGKPVIQRRARHLLAARGYVVCFVTSRTSEIVMSWYARRLSVAEVRRRPVALLKSVRRQQSLASSSRWRAVDPASLPTMVDVIDPAIIAATTGVELFIQQPNGGYWPDQEWKCSLSVLGTSAHWRRECLRLIKQFRDQMSGRKSEAVRLPVAESVRNYRIGRSIVFPPPYRVQVDFATATDKISFQKLLRRERQYAWIEESNPAHDSYSLYIIPRGINKQTVADRIISQLAQAVGAAPARLEVLCVGDSMSDLMMGLRAGAAAGVKATFLVVGGSRLTQPLTSRNQAEFAGNSLSAIKHHLHKTNHRRGWYTFKQAGVSRPVVFGDLAFFGTIGPQTICAYLKTQP